MDTLSIVQIVSSGEWGGREQHVLELTRGLQEAGHQVVVVTRDHSMHFRRYREAAETVVLPLRNLTDWRSVKELARIICERKVDCVHVHTGRDAWLALFATKMAGRGRVFNSRHTVSRAKTDFLHRWYYRNLAAVICVSDMVRREFLQVCPIVQADKVVTVHNGIDVRPFLAQAASRRPFDGETFVIGYAGRISPEKGLEHLVDAVGLLAEQGEMRIELQFAGQAKPEYKRLLEERIADWKIEDRVCFSGFQENVAEFMNGLDAFVLPCVWQEAFGLVLCEAMVCGKPTLSTKTGAQTELIEHGCNGLLVDEPSGAAVARKLQQLIEKPDWARYLGEQGKETVLERFTLQHMVERMVRCYRQHG